ncbi:TnsD family Tn7-like transposition protein [Paraburkholderia tropica]|uniref:TnsD family Tn7-like transposition protein n=1 Tax=Paraburkholderia tropica TaxID=92647 RepID=UPI002ABD22A2|nr:TnsD family Tn7-like transposition protein [Paraburkholderia tropica]
MLNYFPKLYEDESWYSVVARYHRHTNSRSWVGTCRELFGADRAVGIPVNFASNLAAAKTRIGDWIPSTAEQIAWDTTILPFMVLGRNEELRKRALDGMIEPSGDSESPYAIFGIGATLQKGSNFLKTCPVCLQCDKLLGEAYWRRSHQIPGFHMCLIHDCLLVETNVQVNSEKWKPASGAELNMLTRPYLASLSDMDVTRIREISSILAGIMSSPSSEVDCAGMNIQEEMKLSNYIRVNGAYDHARLEKQFEKFYGESVLGILGLEVSSVGVKSWLSRYIHSKAPQSPLKRVLLENFFRSSPALPSSVQLMKAGPWKCQNLFCQHRGHRTIKSFKLVARKIGRAGKFECGECGYVFVATLGTWDADGQPIIDRVLSYGHVFRSELFRRFAVDRQIASVAREFGISHRVASRLLSIGQFSPERLPRRDKGKVRKQVLRLNKRYLNPKRGVVDWSARDEELSSQLIEAAKNIRKICPPERVSRNSLLASGQPKIMSLFNGKTANSLPKTKIALNNEEESYENFWWRRVKWAHETWPTGLAFNKRNFLRRAGIESSDISPELRQWVERLFSS